MKKLLLILLFVFISLSDIYSQTIKTLPLSQTEYCINDQISIPFEITGTFAPDNVYIAQLSDEKGTFNTFTKIATLKGNSSGTITSPFPQGTNTLKNYRVRIISSNPYVAGSDNGSNIRIKTYFGDRFTKSGNVYFEVNENINLLNIIKYTFDTTTFVCQWNFNEGNPITYIIILQNQWLVIIAKGIKMLLFILSQIIIVGVQKLIL